MGNSSIIYHPEGLSGREPETIDFGRRISQINETHVQSMVEAEGVKGNRGQRLLYARTNVVLLAERIGPSEAALVRRLESVNNHLQRGGSISFHGDHDKRWANYLTSLPGANSTLIRAPIQQWDWLLTSATALIGDDVVIETLNSAVGYREVRQVSGWDGPTSTLIIDEGVDFQWSGAPSASVVGVRHRDTFPTLRIPTGRRNQQMLQTDYRHQWTWRAELEYVALFSNPAL